MRLEDIARVTYSSCLNQGGMQHNHFTRFIDLAVRLDLAGVIIDVKQLTELKGQRNWQSLHATTALIFSEENRWRLARWASAAFRHEIHEAQHGANVVEVLMNMRLLKAHRWRELLREIRAVEQAPRGQKAVDKRICWVIDTRQITAAQMADRLPKLRSSGICSVKVSSELLPGQVYPRHIEAVRQALGDEVVIVASGCRAGIGRPDVAENLLKAGADFISTTKAKVLFRPLIPRRR